MSSLAGLSSIEARSRFEAYGPNEIVEKGGRSILKIFIDQFTNILVVLLGVAAIVAYLTGEKIDAGLIIGIVILNGVLGFVQEYKAEDAIKKLKGMGAGKIRVRRDGMDVEIESREIVVGDVVFVEEGLRIPADGVVLESTFLEVNESVLTGESMPIAKEVGTIYAGQLYSGTIVSRGKGWMGVEETGMNTKFGKLAESLKSINSEETPLEQKLKKLSGVMVGIGVVGCLAVVLKMGLLGREWMLAWASGVSLAVAVIPEGLPAVLAITLAMGVTKMAREKAVMRKLAAVEALGGASVIATDKTGTITKNEMEVKRMEIDGDEADLMRCGVLASTAVLVEKDNGEWDVIGDQTEGAVLKLATSHNIDIEAERVKHTVIAEYPFDSN
jgi:Ca2+-transporting ATPase